MGYAPLGDGILKRRPYMLLSNQFLKGLWTVFTGYYLINRRRCSCHVMMLEVVCQTPGDPRHTG